MTRDALVVWSEEPLLVETPAELLVETPVTPVGRFYVRNHGPMPELDAGSFRLAVGGLVREPLELSLDDLRALPRVEVVATLVCAGNRRAELAELAPIPGETPWGPGAIGNAAWSGVRLRDVLAAAGVADGARHVSFAGVDPSAEADEFGASIPLAKALAPEVVLADRMNGEPLPVEHGFPLRVVVPGFVGARSVKWLARIEVAAEPSANHFQAASYRLEGEALADVALSSAICRVDTTGAAGYAVAGGGREIAAVELSQDGGLSWAEAELSPAQGPWSWRLWRAPLRAAPGAELVVRARDGTGTMQPERPLWNAKGYANDGWHRVRPAH